MRLGKPVVLPFTLYMWRCRGFVSFEKAYSPHIQCCQKAVFWILINTTQNQTEGKAMALSSTGNTESLGETYSVHTNRPLTSIQMFQKRRGGCLWSKSFRGGNHSARQHWRELKTSMSSLMKGNWSATQSLLLRTHDSGPWKLPHGAFYQRIFPPFSTPSNLKESPSGELLQTQLPSWELRRG